MLTLENNSILGKWYGCLEYEESLNLQSQIWNEVKQSGHTSIIGLEHSSVITLGKRAEPTIDIVAGTQIPIVQTDRGGQATLHSPGQLVIYPIAPVKTYGGLKSFVCLLLKSTRLCLEHYGVQAQTSEHAPGLYTERGKIAFIGLRIESGISRHGLSINISNDLKLFQNIRSCGIQRAQLDHLKSWTQAPSTEEFFSSWLRFFIEEVKKLNTKL